MSAKCGVVAWLCGLAGWLISESTCGGVVQRYLLGTWSYFLLPGLRGSALEDGSVIHLHWAFMRVLGRKWDGQIESFQSGKTP